MGWAGISSGFATGLQAGSQAAQRAYQARADYENQEYLKEQRAEEQRFKAEIRGAAAPAETTTQQGLQVTGPEGNSFYIPAEAKEAAATYAREGYTVAEAPTTYSEARVTGGRTLAQREYTPEQQELGRAPVAGLQEQYNADKFKRMEQVALQYDRPERAAAYGTLQMQPLQRQVIEEQLKDLPQIRELRGVQIEGAKEEVISKKTANEIAQYAQGWTRATESQEAAIEHYNTKFKDGSTAVAVPAAGGMTQLMKVDKNGNQTPLGKPYESWEKGGMQQIQAKIPELAKEAWKLDKQHEHKMAEIAETGRWHQRYAATLKADKRVNMTDEQRQRFGEIEAEINAAGDDEDKLRTANQKMAVLNNQVAMANGLMPKPYVFPKSGRDYTADDLQKFGKAQAEFLEIAPQIYKGWANYSPADKEKILKQRNLWTLGGKGKPDVSGKTEDPYIAGSGVASTKPRTRTGSGTGARVGSVVPARTAGEVQNPHASQQPGTPEERDAADAANRAQLSRYLGAGPPGTSLNFNFQGPDAASDFRRYLDPRLNPTVR